MTKKWCISSAMLGFVLTASLSLSSGCGSGPIVVKDKNPPDPTKTRLADIAIAYFGFPQANGRFATSPKDIVGILKEGEQGLKSARDNEPFVIAWGLDPGNPTWAKTCGIIAYEKNGLDGKRYVLTTTCEVALVSDEKFRKLDFPPGHTPPK